MPGSATSSSSSSSGADSNTKRIPGTERFAFGHAERVTGTDCVAGIQPGAERIAPAAAAKRTSRCKGRCRIRRGDGSGN